jgi:hypothetical protein
MTIGHGRTYRDFIALRSSGYDKRLDHVINSGMRLYDIAGRTYIAEFSHSIAVRSDSHF